jgi:hypothetical protein
LLSHGQTSRAHDALAAHEVYQTITDLVNWKNNRMYARVIRVLCDVCARWQVAQAQEVATAQLGQCMVPVVNPKAITRAVRFIAPHFRPGAQVWVWWW